MGGWLLLKPAPPRPLPSPAAPQASPSQVINPTPSAERVNIEMGSGNAPSLQVQAFDASPNPVRPGERATLSWSVPGATEVNISPSIGSVAAQGSRVISPRTGEVFTLTAKGADGQTVSRTLNLMVAVNNSPPQQQARDNGPPPQQQAPPERPPQQEQYQPAPPPQQEQYQPVAPPRQAPQQQTQASASPMMNVYHDHGLATGNQYTWPSCWGQLQIGGGKVVYHVLGTSDGRRDDFVAPVSAVDEVKVNRVPIRGRPAFHMRINGQNFNFVPASGAPIMFVNVINQWLAK
jgi:hypothetical protein